jgi:UDP-GlcNAc3NAcA epimerase
MITLVTIIGARPQIIKAAALSRAIRTYFPQQIREIIVHTGQHYDANMSQVFFDELAIPLPDYNLQVGSGAHGEQTAKMIMGIEQILLTESPQALVVYGDTNSTLAGAIAASKLHIPIVHIEAGLRSFNKKMPEEINRILCDHASTLLFTPTQAGMNNLKHEGFKLDALSPFTADQPGVFHCGDIMFDNTLFFSTLADQKSTALHHLQLENNSFVLVTIHRNDNTDVPEHLNGIFNGLLAILEESDVQLVAPLHPRTKKMMEQNLTAELRQKIDRQPRLKLIEPVSFLEMIWLEKNASIVLTDSGGVQKEAYFVQKPCIILRQETEWIELVDCGAAKLAGHDADKILAAYRHFMGNQNVTFPPIFGDGEAAKFICSTMVQQFA